MQVNLKQAAVKRFIYQIRPDIEVKFDNSRRAKRLMGVADCLNKMITLYRPLFQYVLDACKDTALHELAHIFQYEISGKSCHDKEFRDIYKMLLEDYGTKSIRAANRDSRSRYATYEQDKK